MTRNSELEVQLATSDGSEESEDTMLLDGLRILARLIARASIAACEQPVNGEEGLGEETCRFESTKG
jgi:hypothetical protein